LHANAQRYTVICEESNSISADVMSSFPLLCERAGTAYPSAISSLRQTPFLLLGRIGEGHVAIRQRSKTVWKLHVSRLTTQPGTPSMFLQNGLR